MSATATAPASPGPFSRRVLLVDSRPILLDGVTLLLEQYRPRLHVVGRASTYRRAVEVIRQTRPDVVLFSVFHDAIAPMEALTALLRHARVVVLKGLNDTLPVSTLLGLGAAAVVTAEQPVKDVVDAILHAGAPRLNGDTRPRPAARMLPPEELRIRPPDDQLTRLTNRECELIGVLLAHPGAKYLVIGAEMGISEHTVHNHLSSIYQKLNLVNRNDLLLYAMRNGLAGSRPERVRRRP